MSSIHEIARIEEAHKSQNAKEYQLTLAEKSQEQIKDELK